MKWRPIKTAPKDGAEILTYSHQGYCLMFWLEDEQRWEHSFYGGSPQFHPTHWMPLPEAPK